MLIFPWFIIGHSQFSKKKVMFLWNLAINPGHRLRRWRALERDGEIDRRAGTPKTSAASVRLFFVSCLQQKIMQKRKNQRTPRESAAINGFQKNWYFPRNPKILTWAVSNDPRYGEQIQEMNFQELVDFAKKAQLLGFSSHSKLPILVTLCGNFSVFYKNCTPVLILSCFSVG